MQSLSVSLGLGCHGRADMTLWTGSKFADSAAGDAFELSLGPKDDEVPVMTGTVIGRHQTTGGLKIEALDSSGILSRTRLSITFEESSVDDIVSRIASEADLDVTSDAGDTLSIYYVSAHRPLWDHLRELARLTGRDLSVDPEGQIRFLADGAGSEHTLRYGAELITWDVVATETPVPLAFAAHGTASESGNWHWVGSDPLGEEPGHARVIGTFADRSLADAAAEASAARASRAALQGRLTVTGNAELRPADTIQVTDLPGGDPDPLRIRTVHHSIDGETGFTTTLEIEGGGDGGGLLGALAGGLP